MDSCKSFSIEFIQKLQKQAVFAERISEFLLENTPRIFPGRTIKNFSLKEFLQEVNTELSKNIVEIFRKVFKKIIKDYFHKLHQEKKSIENWEKLEICT